LRQKDSDVGFLENGVDLAHQIVKTSMNDNVATMDGVLI
jgi:hypothetical protein